MSIIRYRFKSSKDFDSITFEGNGIHVWELKDEIISAKKLARSADFDLIISNAQSNEDYTDENQSIPKNTSVIVRRVPKSSLHTYNVRSRQPTERSAGITKSSAIFHRHAKSRNEELDKEEDKIKAMAKASSEEWSKQLDIQEAFGAGEKYSSRKPTPGTAMAPAPFQSGRVPHPSYVCYRCGEKGHFINDCPLTAANPNDHTRIKRVTGIPKSFLKPAEGLELKKTMISYDGSRVVYRPNQHEWDKFHSMAQAKGDPMLAPTDDMDNIMENVDDEPKTEPQS